MTYDDLKTPDVAQYECEGVKWFFHVDCYNV
jgi:hypothetical protein